MPERRAGKEAQKKEGERECVGGWGEVGRVGWAVECRGWRIPERVSAVIIQASRTLTKFDVRERL